MIPAWYPHTLPHLPFKSPQIIFFQHQSRSRSRKNPAFFKLQSRTRESESNSSGVESWSQIATEIRVGFRSRKKWVVRHCLSYKFRCSNKSFVIVSYIFDAVLTFLHLKKYTFTFINSESESKKLKLRSRSWESESESSERRSRQIQSRESEPKKLKRWSRNLTKPYDSTPLKSEQNLSCHYYVHNLYCAAESLLEVCICWQNQRA